MRARSIITIFLFIGINSFGHAQAKKRDRQFVVDSLKGRIHSYSNADSLTKAYGYLSVLYRGISLDSAVYFAKIGVDKGELAKDPLNIGKTLMIYGTNLADVGKYKESLEQLFNAEKVLKETENHMQLGNVYTNIGRSYAYMSDYKNAIDFYYKGVQAYEKGKVLTGEVTARMNVINMYITVKEFDEAEKLVKILYPRVLALKDSAALCSYYVTSASIFIDTKPDKALEDYYKALPLSIKYNKFEFQAFIEISIAKIYLERCKRTNNKNDQQLAQEFFEKGRITSEKHNVVSYISSCYNALAELALLDNDPMKCIEMSHKALGIENSFTQIKSNIMASYNTLYMAYEKLKRYDSALIYLKKATDLREEFSKNEIKSKMMGEEMNYRVEKNTELNKAKLAAENERDITIRNSVIIVLSCIVLIVILLVSYLYMRYQRGRQKEFSILLIQTQEEERKRISKDLHDGIGQNLLMIKSECGNNTPLVEITIDELRTISRNLHPVQLEKLGLKEALESVVQSAEKSSSIFFSYEIEDINSLLDNNQQINLYRTVQETLSNIIKHSKATSARITVEKQKNQVVTTIYDDGIGFNISEMKKKKSLGLTSMSERVKLMDGTLTIMSGSKGTRVEIKINYG